ncbi:type IV secretory system conjugative DNA transfer family protein [Methylobacterium sp. NMS12]|uniref:type IV secretory system conjugative DNA transfer family protein n=1 Tax=Methylobacterium sp. NMS12 TaxID=3079766 RepID=UPI003F885624
MIAWFKSGVLLLTAFLLGYPVLTLAQHGYDIRLWPDLVLTPDRWLAFLRWSWGAGGIMLYTEMFTGISPAIVGGGMLGAWAFFGLTAALVGVILVPRPAAPRRDPNATYGDARLANLRERRQMSAGLELGRDPDTGRPIRVAVRSNLISIAPPRTGKTSGLVIPNLAAPEAEAWFGPCVVIDPKGEVYRAVAERRRALGRHVRCLDPVGLVGGTDRFNPLLRTDPRDILYLQRVARALLPVSSGGDHQYFRDRGVDAIVSGFLAARKQSTPTPAAVARLLGDPEMFAAALNGLKAAPAVKLRALLAADPRTRDPILSTAMQAFAWCDDPRLQHLTGESSFALSDLGKGNTDLFLTVPTEDLESLAPLIRWLLTEVFTTIRRRRPRERLMIFIDEAFALGRFREIVVAAGELPGANASLWTFWQDRSQIIATYGEAEARTLLNAAEITTVSDPALVDPDEREHWSRALGDYTLLEESRTTEATAPGRPGRTTTALTPKAVRLRSAEALGRLPAEQLLVLPNSRIYAKRPLILRKTRHDDARLRGLVRDVGGTAAAG